MPGRVVVLGTGQAGFASLRAEAYEGEIVLLRDEQGLPYHCPALSNAYVLGRWRRLGFIPGLSRSSTTDDFKFRA